MLLHAPIASVIYTYENACNTERQTAKLMVQFYFEPSPTAVLVNRFPAQRDSKSCVTYQRSRNATDKLTGRMTDNLQRPLHFSRKRSSSALVAPVGNTYV